MEEDCDGEEAVDVAIISLATSSSAKIADDDAAAASASVSTNS